MRLFSSDLTIASVSRFGKIRNAMYLAPFICCMSVLPINAIPAWAEANHQTDFSIIVGEVRTVSVDRENLDLIPVAAELIAGWTRVGTLNITVSANVEWALSIRGSEPFWEAPWNKPVGDIFWSYNGSEYFPLDVIATEVLTGGPSDNEIYPLNFKISLDPLEDIPGDYYYPEIIIEVTSL